MIWSVQILFCNICYIFDLLFDGMRSCRVGCARNACRPVPCHRARAQNVLTLSWYIDSHIFNIYQKINTKHQIYIIETTFQSHIIIGKYAVPGQSHSRGRVLIHGSALDDDFQGRLQSKFTFLKQHLLTHQICTFV